MLPFRVHKNHKFPKRIYRIATESLGGIIDSYIQAMIIIGEWYDFRSRRQTKKKLFCLGIRTVSKSVKDTL